MSDYSDGPKRRERHRRHKGRASSGGAQKQAQGHAQGVRSPGNARQAGGRDQAARQDVRRPQRPESRFEHVADRLPVPKLPTPTCARCGDPILDVSCALTDRQGGGPVHFDCALSFLNGAENVSPDEKIVYIGQGKFAVMRFENPADPKTFRILRTIEWEGREARAEWRNEIAGSFSQVP